MHSKVRDFLLTASSIAILGLVCFAIWAAIVYHKRIMASLSRIERAAAAVNSLAPAIEKSVDVVDQAGKFLPTFETTTETVQSVANAISCIGCKLCSSTNPFVQDFVADTGICSENGCIDPTTCQALGGSGGGQSALPVFSHSQETFLPRAPAPIGCRRTALTPARYIQPGAK